MRVAALAVGEEGEEEEEEEDEEEEEEKEAQTQAGHHHGARGPAMSPAATAAVGGRSRWPATTCPFLFVLLLLLPVWILTTIVVNASPLHPAPPYRGESRFTFLCWLVGDIPKSIYIYVQ